MIIATWNLDARPHQAKIDLLLALDADVLLLTQVPVGLELPGYHLTPPGAVMAQGQGWAAVASRRPQLALASPQAATTAAVVDGVTYVSSVLPWPGAGQDPWQGTSTSERLGAAVDDLEPFLASQEHLVWGGDQNQTMAGGLSGSTGDGRDRLERALTRLSLELLTRDLPRGALEMTTIDHIALRGTTATGAHVAVDRSLSHHDVYVVTV